MKQRRWILVVSMLAWQPPSPALAADAAPTAADITRLEGEIARLQQDLRDQRQLVLQLMQMQETMLRSLHGGGPPPGPMPPVPRAGPGASATPAPAASPAGPSVGAGGSATATGAVTGHVHVGGKFPAEAYVYVDGPRATIAHPPTIEIKQANRQFIPAVAVVPVGARVLFPNQDTVFHNVFSNTPGDAFDVGTLKTGQTPKPVTLMKPGHVEVFCNIHSKMRADVLVVPNIHFARVHPDGTFHLPGVPVGSRRIVVWAPDIKPVSQTVEVSPEGATVNLTTEPRPPAAHLNKQGSAYGSYEN